VPAGASLGIDFIDVVSGEEKDQRESFVNENEAECIADYLKTMSHIDFNSLAVMSPFRTQALLIKNLL
jgi:superfamily I DNA and/or RNA helicase